MSESIRLVDFCGYTSPGHFPITYWADWNPSTKLVTFGGEWVEVSPIISETEPTETEIEELSDFAWWTLIE